MTKNLTLLQLLFLVLISGFFSGCNENSNHNNTPVEVKKETALVQRAEFYTQIKGYGTLEAQNSLDLEAKFDGIVHFEHLHGRIKKGETIYSLGGPEIALKKENLEKSLAIAQSQYEYAKQYYEAQKKLLNKNYLSRIDFEKVARDFQNAQNNLNTAEYELKYFQSMINYKAPFSGYLDHLKVPQGEDAVAGQVLATFQDDRHLKLVAPYYGSFKSLSSREILLNINGKNYKGKIIYKEEALSPATGGHTLWITINNAKGLKSGEYVAYAFLLDKRSSLSVPEASIIEQKGKYFVIVVNNKNYIKQPVTIGSEQNGKVEILSGLQPKVKVLTKGAFEVFYGNIEKTMKIED